MNVTVLSLTDYEIGNLIHQSDRTLVDRGCSKNDSQPVAIKLMRNEYFTISRKIEHWWQKVKTAIRQELPKHEFNVHKVVDAAFQYL